MLLGAMYTVEWEIAVESMGQRLARAARALLARVARPGREHRQVKEQPLSFASFLETLAAMISLARPFGCP